MSIGLYVVISVIGAFLYLLIGIKLYQASKRLGPITQNEEDEMNDFSKVFLPKLWSFRDPDEDEQVLSAILWPAMFLIDGVMLAKLWFRSLLDSALSDSNF